MKVASLALGPLQTNAYLAWNDAEEAVLIDPGCEPEKLLTWINDLAVRPRAILLTHAHFDHVGAVAAAVREYAAPVYLHSLALPVYRRAAEAAKNWGFQIEAPPTADPLPLEEGDLAVGPGFTVLHLPGHCPGHVAFYNRAAGAAFAGDVLFAGGVGRWDIPSANKEQLEASIRKLFGLPDQTTIYPGHGPATTLAAEKGGNRYVRAWLEASS